MCAHRIAESKIMAHRRSTRFNGFNNDDAMDFDEESEKQIAQDKNAQGLTDEEIDHENSRLQYPSSDSSNLNMSGVSMTSQEQLHILEMAKSSQSYIQQNEQFRSEVSDLQTQLREKESYIRQLEANAVKTPKTVHFNNTSSQQHTPNGTAIAPPVSPQVSSAEALEMASLLKSIKSEVQSRDAPFLSDKEILTSSDILQQRTLALVSNSHPRNPLVDKDFNEMRDVITRVVQKLSNVFTEGSETSILRIIRHYGGLLLVCPHEPMLKGILKLNAAPDDCRSFGCNGGTYVIRRYEASIFSNSIAVITNNFAISNACDFATDVHSALSPAQWTQIGDGKPDARNEDTVIHEFHVPSADYAIIQSELLNKRICDDNNNHYKFRLAADRFDSHDFKFTKQQLLAFAQDLSKKYHPIKGIKAYDDDRFFSRGRQMNRGEQYPRNRSRSRSRY